MPFTLTMPKLSPTMDEGTITKWLKKEGEFVEEGEALMEVATDKATVEHTVLDEGWLRKIIVPEDGTVVVNQAIAIFTEEKTESIEGYVPEGIDPVAAEVSEEQGGTAEVGATAAAGVASGGGRSGGGMAEPAFTPEPPLEGYTFPYPTDSMSGRMVASPLAKKMAAEKGLDIGSVKGSGPHGRIVSRDLERAQASGPVGFGRREIPIQAPGSYESIKPSPMRKVIGKRLQESKTFIPHFYVRQEINVEPLIEARKQLKSWGVKISYNDFIVRASAMALRKHPVINSGYDTVEGAVIKFQTIDVAIAVSVDGGLLTPVIRHTDYKNVGEISTEIRALAGRARDGKLQPEEYKGGSFTISNLGMYGISDFVAVINPPQGAILAVGGMEKKPVIQGDSIVAGTTMNFTLSSDHRIIDGVAAAEYLRTLKGYLENPAGLLL